MLNCVKFGVLFMMSATACTVIQAAMTTEHTTMSRRSNMRGEGGISTGSNTMTTIDTPPPPLRQLSEVAKRPTAEIENEVMDSRQLRPRIIGGTNATKGQFPSFVDVAGCGGTLIDRYFVLTAAHCVNSTELRKVRENIYLGAYSDVTGTTVKVEEFIIHPGDDDIALLRIGCASRRRVQALNFNSSIPFNTIKQGHQTIPQPLTVIGMGRTSQNGTRSETLLHTQVNVVPTNVCNASYSKLADVGPNVINGTTMICAGNMETGGKNSCKGDSGGPVYIMVPQKLAKIDPPPVVPVQVGIAAFGYPDCGSKEFPGVHTRVSAYENWIKSNIAKYYAANPTIKYCFNKST